MLVEKPTTERIPGYCALCVSRCGAIAVVENGRFVALEPDPSHPTGIRATGICTLWEPARIPAPECLRQWFSVVWQQSESWMTKDKQGTCQELGIFYLLWTS